MPDAKNSIRELLETGKRFLVASDPSFDESALFASAALKKILDAAGKEVLFWPPVSEAFARSYAPILEPHPFPDIPRKIKIRIPKRIPLEELRYDDEPDAMSIVISPKLHLDIKDLLIERVPYDMDGAFCFFSDEALLEKIGAPVARPARERTVYLVRNARTLAEKVADISETVENPSARDPSVSTLLFASLAAETDLLRIASPGALRLAGTLAERGADTANARIVLDRAPTPEEAQLLGRALARTTFDAPLNARWTFLGAKDFEKTGLAPSSAVIRLLFKKISSVAGSAPLFVMCYEDSVVHAAFAGTDTATMHSISERLGLAPANLLLSGPIFPSFSEAETEIRRLLKTVREVKLES